MIDHSVLIGDIDVSKHVISVSCDQTIENDANPGKATVVLANVDMMYTDAFIPQLHEMNIFLFNFVYTDTMTFRVFEGKVTDAVANPENGEITITAEDDLGHLVDALPHKFNFERGKCTEILDSVLKTHDTDIPYTYDVSTDPEIGPVVWDEQNNYQDVLLAIQERTGCLYYFNEKGILVLYDANHLTEFMDLDRFVRNPCQAKSIMGYVNELELCCYRSEDDTAELQNNPDHEILVGTYEAPDDYSPGSIKKLTCPLKYIYNIHNQEAADAAAQAVWEFYNTKRDAMTELTLEGIVPPLQSLVKYDSFVPVDSDAAATELYGMVLERNISYSADGLVCTIKIHPRTDISELASLFPKAVIPPESAATVEPTPIEEESDEPHQYGTGPYRHGDPIVDDENWLIAPSTVYDGFYFVQSKTGDRRVPPNGDVYPASRAAELYGKALPT